MRVLLLSHSSVLINICYHCVFLLSRNIWTAEQCEYGAMAFDQYIEKLNGQDPLLQDTYKICHC